MWKCFPFNYRCSAFSSTVPVSLTLSWFQCVSRCSAYPTSFGFPVPAASLCCALASSCSPSLVLYSHCPTLDLLSTKIPKKWKNSCSSMAQTQSDHSNLWHWRRETMCLGNFTRNQNKGDRDLWSGATKAEKTSWLWYKQKKKEQASGGSERKASSMLCEKKEGESGLEQILNFRLVLCSFYTNCITGKLSNRSLFPTVLFPSACWCILRVSLCGQALERIARDAETEKTDFHLGKHNYPLLPRLFSSSACAPLYYYKAAQDKKLWQNNVTAEN